MKLRLEFAQNLANERGGTCLSSSYQNRHTPLSWRCSEGYSWLAQIDSIQRGTWCPHCVRESKKLDIESVKELACSKNGEYLSDVYINHTMHLRWRCSKNHQWYATLSRVKNYNTWCPYCSKYKHERLCQEIMSKYLGPPSKICRPDFLKTLNHPTGLELDIYYP